MWRIDAVSDSLGTHSDGYRRGRTSRLDSGPWAGTGLVLDIRTPLRTLSGPIFPEHS